MLNHLTNYLLQYKTVTVPNVGTLRIVQQSPQLNVADKVIEPPSYIVEIGQEENTSDHQLNFLRSFSGNDNDAVAMKLELFGNSLHQKISDGGFNWTGIGFIGNDTRTLSLRVNALQVVNAERIIRQDARHTVLVGDNHVIASHVADGNTDKNVTGKKRAISVSIGWILLVLALLAIALFLYMGKFGVNATGSKLPPSSWVDASATRLKL